jgi:hypothetical protein
VIRRINLMLRIRGTGTYRHGIRMQVAGLLLPSPFPEIPTSNEERYGTKSVET